MHGGAGGNVIRTLDAGDGTLQQGGTLQQPWLKVLKPRQTFPTSQAHVWFA